MPEYRCANCLKPCKPRLEEVGLSASCCSEAILLVMDGCEARTLDTSEELSLAYDLAMEADAARSPADRARFKIANGP